MWTYRKVKQLSFNYKIQRIKNSLIIIVRYDLTTQSQDLGNKLKAIHVTIPKLKKLGSIGSGY